MLIGTATVMTQEPLRECSQCGKTLVPGRRFCVHCNAPVPRASSTASGQLVGLAREIPSTHRPDHTIVFVPERRDARLARERKRRRLIIGMTCLIAAISAIGFSIWRVRVHQREVAQRTRRERMATREIDLYAKSLELFFADNGRYPSAREGLGALVRRPQDIASWRGPYIEGDYSVDPWGNDYVYHVTIDGTGYELFTFGPDGEGGGRRLITSKGGRPFRADELTAASPVLSQ
jgi:general secretion pathway protein G